MRKFRNKVEPLRHDKWAERDARNDATQKMADRRLRGFLARREIRLWGPVVGFRYKQFACGKKCLEMFGLRRANLLV